MTRHIYEYLTYSAFAFVEAWHVLTVPNFPLTVITFVTRGTGASVAALSRVGAQAAILAWPVMRAEVQI